MRRVAALLAAVPLAFAGVAIAGCGEDGAEPGAPRGATLVLDFQPNAVHSGIYAAKAEGFLADAGVELEIREPSSSSDSSKLLQAGRADFAILDVNDFGLARERGLDIAAIAAIVQRPLASVIAADASADRTPADLRGATVGVTGVPSDEAVLETVLAQGGVPPGEVERQTIGFESVRLLAARKLDAATAFWNAEGVELRRSGLSTREFRVDEFGAPRYPELVLAMPGDELESDPTLACGLTRGLERGYSLLGGEPEAAMSALLGAVPSLDPSSQRDQLEALYRASAFSPGAGSPPTSMLSSKSLNGWLGWAQAHGVIGPGPEVSKQVADGFGLDLSARCLR